MKILLYAPSPLIKTGYGTQAALFAPLLRELGHDVAIHAFTGLEGEPMVWEGVPVWPSSHHSLFGHELM
ncbi:MAG: hypothetical protein J2P32_11030 [Actinobacteria bacterium]|nr:hypothetical protein [Actinomycetota bacterium]